MKTSAKLMMLLSLLALTACAPKVPAPDSQVSLATSAITQAESIGAYDSAPIELKSAREKLNQAKLAMQKKDNLSAQRLADEAIVDANLAQAKARTAKSRKAVAELKENIRTLQEEVDKSIAR